MMYITETPADVSVSATGMPYRRSVPLRSVPKGVVDQVHKKRVVTDHTYPFGFGISANDGVGIDHLPDIKLSSGVRYASSVAVLQTAGVGVLMWKRDAVSAYRQVPINPRDLWKCGLVGRHVQATRLPQREAATPL